RHVEGSTELTDTFLHPEDAHAERRGRSVLPCVGVVLHAAAGICDLEHDERRRSREANRSIRTRCVATDIGEAFLHDTEERRLYRLRQWSDFDELHGDVNAAALHETFDVPPHGRGQTVCSQRRGMQQVSQCAYFLSAA